MFRKTIQNIETTRTGPNQPYLQQELPNGFNTERYQRYLPLQEQPKPSQRKNLTSAQFSQLKKIQTNKTPELVIRQCDPTELNHYKKSSRPLDDNPFPYQAPNTSNKKQRLPINPRLKPYDSNFKQPLDQIHFSDRQNKSERYSSSIDPIFDLQTQLDTLKQYLLHFQNQQTHEIKKIKTNLTQVQNQCNGELQNVANQVSHQLNKQRDEILNINKRAIETQREIRHLKDSINSFVKDNEQKMQSLVLQMNGGNVKKSKQSEEFGVDLKTSSHCISGGVGTSMSVNFQSENINLKLYNETSAQLQMLKGELQVCKQKIELLEKDTKILQLQKKTSSESKDTVKEKIDLKEVQRMMIEKFSQERKKNGFGEKIQDLAMKTKDLYKVYQDMDGNIKGMNDEFARVLNGTIIKKEKMLEAKLNAAEEKIAELNQKHTEATETINQKLTAQSLLSSLRPQINTQISHILQQKCPQIKVLKIREPTSQEKCKLQSVKEAESTYLMDEEGHLIDCMGNYIVEMAQNGSKQRVKLEKNVMYLLEAQGVEVRSC